MKKRCITFLAIGVLALCSCEKTVTTMPAEPGSATIKGKLMAPLDLSNDTTDLGVFTAGLKNEAILGGGVVTAVVDSKDLQKNPQNNYNYELLKYTAIVAPDGSFELTGIPAYSENINVELKFQDFESNQTQFDPSNNPTLNKVFSLRNQNVSVYDGAMTIKSYSYTAN